MSVILYSERELANVYAVVLSGYYRDNGGRVEKSRKDMLAEALAMSSVANVAAYNRTYNVNESPVTAAAVQRAAESLRGDVREAVRVVTGLRYNQTSNGGTYGTGEAEADLDALHSLNRVATDLLRTVAEMVVEATVPVY